MAKQPSKNAANQMWGGRFESAPSSIMQQINASISVDQRLYRHDITGSIAHARMLGATGIIAEAESATLIDGLQNILNEIEAGEIQFRSELEDIHMNIEYFLTQKIGPIGGKLHTARSRNDQVATTFRLWLRDAICLVIEDIKALQGALEQRIAKHQNTLMPGFTHMQTAQPVTLSLHLDAYVQMLQRDIGRFQDAFARLNECPLGACALAGTQFPINRDMTAKELGFSNFMPNTMDAVSARDFVLEFLSTSALCTTHLSRLAEEIILWSSTQFGYICLTDEYTSGSSIMPQKKNPDAAELVRAKTGQISGNLMQMLMVMKALPLTYNKDMQEDKKSVFDCFDSLRLCLQAMAGMISTMLINTDKMRQDALNGYSTATRLADWLVMNLDIPFREAHHLTGKIVKLAESKNLRLDELSLADYQSIEPRITGNILDMVSI